MDTFILPLKSPGLGHATSLSSIATLDSTNIVLLGGDDLLLVHFHELLPAQCSSPPVVEGGLGVAEEFSSSLGGKGGATLACSIISVGGTCLAGASPRCPSACKQEIQPNSMTKWMKIDKTGLNG